MTDAELVRDEDKASFALRHSAANTVGAKARAIGTLAHAKPILIRNLRQGADAKRAPAGSRFAQRIYDDELGGRSLMRID